MAMTDAMDDVDYTTVDFNNPDNIIENDNNNNNYNGHDINHHHNNHGHDNDSDDNLLRHPLWVTESHFVYHLYRDDDGRLDLVKDRFGQFLTSPRNLRDLCQYELSYLPSFLESLRLNSVPSDLYPRLLTESILQGQLRSVAFLVSSWPFHVLHIKSVIPLEDTISSDYLTSTVDGNECMSLMDAITIGLLNLKPHARLKHVDFTGFPSDRRLCRELLRLPIIWMRPRDRQTGFLHSLLRKSLAVSKDKVLRYLHKISCIYPNIDLQVRHGHKLGPITIFLDCQMTVDDVPIGLALQGHTPFRYVCQRAWYEFLPEVGVHLHLLSNLLLSKHLTHLQIEDREACTDGIRWTNLLEGLVLLPLLQCLAMPNTVHTTLLPSAPVHLSHALSSLNRLKKLSFASCTLPNSLVHLLTPLPFRLTYLSLRDARLAPDDLNHLIRWPGLCHLRELNLSRNNLGTVSLEVASLLPRMPQVTCFAVSYCSLCIEGIQLIVQQAIDCDNLKVLCIQSFVPPPYIEIRELLRDSIKIPMLQKFVLLPEAYAFPGTHISQRADNHDSMVMICSQILKQLGRPEVQLE